MKLKTSSTNTFRVLHSHNSQSHENEHRNFISGTWITPISNSCVLLEVYHHISHSIFLYTFIVSHLRFWSICMTHFLLRFITWSVVDTLSSSNSWDSIRNVLYFISLIQSFNRCGVDVAYSQRNERKMCWFSNVSDNVLNLHFDRIKREARIFLNLRNKTFWIQNHLKLTHEYVDVLFQLH